MMLKTMTMMTWMTLKMKLRMSQTYQVLPETEAIAITYKQVEI
jgi:hypothetical protein